MNTFSCTSAVMLLGLLSSGMASAQQSAQASPFAPAVGPPLVELNRKSLESSEYMRSYVRRVARARINSENTLVIRDTMGTTIPADSRARTVVSFTEISRSTVIVLPPERDRGRRPLGEDAFSPSSSGPPSP